MLASSFNLAVCFGLGFLFGALTVLVWYLTHPKGEEVVNAATDRERAAQALLLDLVTDTSQDSHEKSEIPRPIEPGDRLTLVFDHTQLKDDEGRQA